MKTRFNLSISIMFLCGFILWSCQKSPEMSKPVSRATLTEFSPVSGGPSTILTLHGAGFGNDPSDVKVTINGKDAVVKSVDDNTITAEVQKRTSSGTVRVILGQRPNAQVLIYDSPFTYMSAQIVSTYLGGKEAGENDGDVSSATLSKPRYLAWGADGVLYFVEDGGSSASDMACIRVLRNNTVSTILKAAESSLVQRMRGIGLSKDESTMYIANDSNADGSMGFGKMTKSNGKFADLTSLWNNSGITFTTVQPINGRVYIAVHSGSKIYELVDDSFVEKTSLPDASGSPASKGNVNGMTWSKDGKTVFFSSRKNHVVYRGEYDVESGDFKDIKIFAGTFGKSGYADGVGTAALFNEPSQMDVDAEGNLYVADRNNNCIRLITPEGEATTYAGSIQSGYVDGLSSVATFSNPEGCQFGPDGALYIADYSNNAIRKIEEGSIQ